jgi:purine-binding chemotaxis protein CheW
VVYDGVTVTVVLNIAGRTIGVVVDSVSDVIDLDDEQIRPAPAFSSTINAGYIVGIGALTQGEHERLLILVDIEKLMTSVDMALVPSPEL